MTSTDVLRPLPTPKPKTNNNTNKNNNAHKNTPTPSPNGGTTPPPPPANGGGVSNLLAVASSKLGTPYVWGAKGPNAFDCSGFVYWCLNNAGVSQSYMTSSGWRDAGRYTRISNFNDIQAGDIVVVSGHVGIATGGGGVIDASSSNGRVVSRSLSGWWENNFKVAWRVF